MDADKVAEEIALLLESNNSNLDADCGEENLPGSNAARASFNATIKGEQFLITVGRLIKRKVI